MTEPVLILPPFVDRDLPGSYDTDEEDAIRELSAAEAGDDAER